MNGSPHELVDSPFSNEKMEAWRAQSIATGVGGALAAMHRLYELVRNDAAADAARADASQAREALVAHLCDQVAAMQERINRLADAVEERQRADDEAARHQRRFDEEPITLPPDIAEKQVLSPPARIEDDQGTLPNELLEGVPPAPSTYPNPELPEPPVVSQPVAISLNKE
jgi:hypothetical protein